MQESWAQAVAEQAVSYVPEEIWQQLLDQHRKRCKGLAWVAARLLDVKRGTHSLIRWAVDNTMRLMGFYALERRFAATVAASLPLPTDAKLVAAARAVQISGVALCVLQGEDFRRCQCFIDLALSETKTRVKQTLSRALEDWTGLAAETRLAS